MVECPPVHIPKKAPDGRNKFCWKRSPPSVSQLKAATRAQAGSVSTRQVVILSEPALPCEALSSEHGAMVANSAHKESDNHLDSTQCGLAWHMAANLFRSATMSTQPFQL